MSSPTSRVRRSRPSATSIRHSCGVSRSSDFGSKAAQIGRASDTEVTTRTVMQSTSASGGRLPLWAPFVTPFALVVLAGRAENRVTEAFESNLGRSDSGGDP